MRRAGALFRSEMERSGLGLSNKKKLRSIQLLIIDLQRIKVRDPSRSAFTGTISVLIERLLLQISLLKLSKRKEKIGDIFANQGP